MGNKEDFYNLLSREDGELLIKELEYVKKNKEDVHILVSEYLDFSLFQLFLIELDKIIFEVEIKFNNDITRISVRQAVSCIDEFSIEFKIC